MRHHVDLPQRDRPREGARPVSRRPEPATISPRRGIRWSASVLAATALIVAACSGSTRLRGSQCRRRRRPGSIQDLAITGTSSPSPAGLRPGRSDQDLAQQRRQGGAPGPDRQARRRQDAQRPHCGLAETRPPAAMIKLRRADGCPARRQRLDDVQPRARQLRLPLLRPGADGVPTRQGHDRPARGHRARGHRRRPGRRRAVTSRTSRSWARQADRGQAHGDRDQPGPQPHEATIVKLADGVTATDLLAMFTSTAAPSGPPPFTTAGGVAGVAPGRRSRWTSTCRRATTRSSASSPTPSPGRRMRPSG